MDDDIFEIEITDLRAFPSLAPVSQPAGGVSEHDDPPAVARGVPRPLRGPSPLAARQRTRGRLLAGVGAVTSLVVALVVVLASAPGPRAALGLLLATPTATATGADTFAVANGTPWGALTADGKVITRGGSSYQSTFFRLDGGTHQLMYVAPPFPMLRCRVSVPATPSDTCPLLTENAGGFAPAGRYVHDSVRVLNLGATVDNLPPGPREMLIAATQALLNDARWLTTIQPGEHYLATDGRRQVAREPLQATLALGLNIELNSVATINGTSCVIICSYPAQSGAIGGWPLLVAATANWRISASDGTVIATTPASSPVAFPPPITPLPLMATWNSGWQVAFAGDATGAFGPVVTLADPAITAASQVLCDIAQAAATGVKVPTADYGVDGWYGLAAHPADGCVLVNQTTSETQQLVGQPELLLYRFGVLLAASAPAHQLNPDLPVADAHEQAVAEQAARAALPPQFATTG